MWLLLACADAPSPAPPPAEVPCAVSPAQLGVPDARIEVCEALAGLPEVLQVRAGGSGHTVVLRDGAPIAERGLPAFASFIAGLGPERTATLDMSAVVALLRAFQAFPMGFDGRASGFALPEVGTSRFTPAPFELVLYAGSGPPVERFRRATLRPPYTAWLLEDRQESGAWVVAH